MNKLNLCEAHLYTQSFFHSCLASWENKGFIDAMVEKWYPGSYIVHYRHNNVQAYGLTTNNRNYIAVNGTDGTMQDWGNNLNAFGSGDFHPGIEREYMHDFAIWARSFTRGKYCGNSTLWCGHSQGAATAQRGMLDQIETNYSRDVQAIVFCGLKLCNRSGIKRMKKNKCRVTQLFMPGDIVDNIGGVEYKLWPPYLAWSKHYGYIVKLPKVERDLIMGHAYSHVKRSMEQLYCNWKMPRQNRYLRAIEEVIKI